MKSNKGFLITLLLAVFMTFTACGGESKGSSTAAQANSNSGASQSSKGGGASIKWPNDEVGNLVSKPSFDYKVKRYLVGEGRKILTVEFPGATKEQIRSYLETIRQEVSATYPDARRDSRWDDDDVWGESFSFKNETGRHTMVSLKWYAEDDAELMIEWVLK